MSTQVMAAVAAAAPNTFQARAVAERMMDEDGFFAQDDWEFQLDTLPDHSREALEAHLAKAPVDHETAVFLRGFLMSSRDISFTPFGD
jgi:hypothetical protein